jgi:uncharacterized phage protein gp47/JayE
VTLPVKDFPTYVNDLVNSWSASLNITPTLTSGDPLLAIMQSVASQIIWLQFLVQQVNNLARASTSKDGDLDTWMADFGIVRNAATSATGLETFATFNPKPNPITIPLGTIAQTIGGAIQYQVIADLTNSNYNSASNSYTLTTGSTGVNVTVQSLTAGISANVQIGQLVQLGSVIFGIDYVINNVAFTNGTDAETDTALRNRFVAYINSLSKATYGAIISTILSFPQITSYNIVENQTLGGSATSGYFFAVIDDGSGNPPSSLVTNVQNALNNIRAFTVQENAFAPTKSSPTISLNIRIASGASSGTIINIISTALVNYVNSLTIGATLYLNNLVEEAIDSSSSVVSVQPGTVLINGSAADLTASNSTVFRITGTNVTIGTY